MGKLFRKEYHEYSNSWFFKSSIYKFKKGELEYKHYLNEHKKVIIKFNAIVEKETIFPVKIDLLYDKKKEQILRHTCSKCGEEACKHYLSIIDYAYMFLNTEIFNQQSLQTYQTKFLEYNEFWQRIMINGKVEIADIYDNSTDKIRFYFKSYKPMNIRLIAIIVGNGDKKVDDKNDIPLAERHLKSLSDAEILLLALLQQNKCSYSRKGGFFTIYKKDFAKFFPILKNLQNKVFIKETGDRLTFPEEEFRVNFFLRKKGEKQYSLEASGRENISAVYSEKTSFILKKNLVYSINFPFTNEITKQIFSGGYPVKKQDIVYLSSVVARQLGLLKCYLDFDEDIKIPDAYHNTPIITFELEKSGENILMTGRLEYSEDLRIPMSVLRFPAELVRLDQNGKQTWFYISPQTKFEVSQFVEKLPESQDSKMEESSQLIFSKEENIEELKKVVFEHADPAWNIVLSEALKKEFIYKVELKPILTTAKSSDINWFEYDVAYNYKDISFSHSELKKFFKTKEKFLKLKDGRLLFFENKEAFDEVDKVLKKSKKTLSDGYKLSVYNLPFVYQLNSVNTGISVLGDNFLDEMFSAILNRQMKERTNVPYSLQPIMRSYQKAGFHWLEMLKKYGFSGILADDMGLGKTIQTIALLSKLPQDSKTIVICPKTLQFNWAAEFDKFSTNISYVQYEGSKEDRKRILSELNVNVMIASYSIIQNDIEILSEIEFDYIVLDEAQHIKNSVTLRSVAVKQLKAKHRLALSGTPIENNPAELWSLFDFLMPGYLPSLNKFKKTFGNINGDKLSQERLKNLISPFVLRRKKKEVLIELPDKQIQTAYCKMSPVQEKLYLQILENVKKTPDKQDYFHILAALTKLRQVCNHPELIDRNLKQDFDLSGKTELMREIIVDAVENGKKLLVFSQFTQMLGILKRMMKSLEIPFEYMDGQTKDRQKRIENFNNNNNIKVFLISLKTGGYGLNLTAADTVILTDPWWNPMGEDQAVDRAHRIGQTKKVLVYKMITKGTIEEKILSLQQNKRDVFENVIDGGQAVLQNLSSEQLRELLEY
jgi:SNF2 family DNA or RNA helicase